MELENQIIDYMDSLWVSIEEEVVTIGIKEENLEDVTEIYHVDLPIENSEIEGEEICGEVHTDDGPINLYSPVGGTILEINSSVISNPKILFEDTDEECWLIRVRCTEPEQIGRFHDENSISSENEDLS